MAVPRRILLVDDEPSIVKMMAKRLEVAGFDVTVAVDGEEALHKAQTLAPDLIVLDLMLPKRNGYEVCAALKHDPQRCQTPILMVTARTQDKDEQLALQSGADGYLRKPFRAQELLERIQGLLGRVPANERSHAP